MENEKIRKKARRNGVPYWQICDEIGISEPTLIRWLRKPLPPDKEAKIISAIEKLSDGEED